MTQKSPLISQRKQGEARLFRHEKRALRETERKKFQKSCRAEK
jgi:hypothetical protein